MPDRKDRHFLFGGVTQVSCPPLLDIDGLIYQSRVVVPRQAGGAEETTTITSSMPNFTLSEIVTIAVVILIVFGPHRLPEMAQKAGRLVRQGRSLLSDLRQEFEGELREVTAPLQELNREVLGIKDEMGTSLTSLTDDVTKAKEEIEAQMAETKKVLEDQVEETTKEIKDVMKEPESASSTEEPSATGAESSDPGDEA